MNNNLQPKTNYQEFLKDIYNAIKKMNQNTAEINDKLDAINKRLSSIESSQLYLGEQLQAKAQQPASSSVSDSHLLELMTKLDDPPELPAVYKLANGPADLPPLKDCYDSILPATEFDSYSAVDEHSNSYESMIPSGFLILE